MNPDTVAARSVSETEGRSRPLAPAEGSMSQVRTFEARSGSLDFDDDRDRATLTFQGTVGGDVQTVTMSRAAFDQFLASVKQRVQDDPEPAHGGG